MGVLKYAVVAVSVGYIVMYLAIVAWRIRYPFELEWQEGAMVDHVRRILEGRPLYVAPSLDFVTYIYTPLYFYVSAVAAKVFGLDFFALRLVSFLSSLGCMGLIFLMVRRETRSPLAGVVAAGFFAAAFRVTGAWLDIARNDSLFVLLLLWGVFLLRFSESAKGYAWAGVILALSFLTKQVAAVVTAPMAVYAVIMGWKRASFFLVPLLLIGIGSTVVACILTSGWYWYYVFYLPWRHPVVLEELRSFWFSCLITPAFTATLIALASLVRMWFSKRRERALFYSSVALGTLGAALVSKMHQGGYDNVLIPLYATMAVLCGIAFGDVLVWARSIARSTERFIESSVFVVYLSQFVFLFYSPVAQIPTRHDLDAGRRIVEVIRQMKGEVFVPYHGYLAEMAGKKGYAHSAAIIDVARGDNSPVSTRLHLDLVEAIREKKFAAIIYDFDRWEWPIGEYYGDPELLLLRMSEFKPVTGLKFSPRWLYYAKPDDSAGRPARAARHEH